MNEGSGADGSGRDGRLRRAGLAGGAVMALAAVAAVVSSGTEAGLPWWVVAALALPTSGLAAWTGARIGRRQGVRDAVLEPGETVTGTYTVRPPYPGHTPPAAHEGPQYQLLLTTRGMQLWERSVLLWRHPWPELRVLADGPRLRIHHQGQEAGTMLLEQPGAVQEIRLAARRYGAG
ncbi:hypothetical protein AB0D29_10650 [Streptomyces sp. NPDC048424]|uniref:hypothetical protein n=1 Tax=Streptomyces sp. NPDC048424 TaxID=3155265 RepID=UPI0034460834